MLKSIVFTYVPPGLTLKILLSAHEGYYMCLRLLEQTAVISKYIQSDRRRVKSKRLEIDPFGGKASLVRWFPGFACTSFWWWWW